ncbi:MAG: hypothetical protein AB7H97_21220, partial [Pseudobdellovibrionaceae bacterium]
PGLRELFQFISEQKKNHPQHQITIDTPYLRNPEHLSVEILTSKFAKYIDHAMDFLRNIEGTPHGFSKQEMQKVDRIKALILENPAHPEFIKRQRQNFYKMIKQYDSRRKVSFLRSFPEYRTFYFSCWLESRR